MLFQVKNLGFQLVAAAIAPLTHKASSCGITDRDVIMATANLSIGYVPSESHACRNLHNVYPVTY